MKSERVIYKDRSMWKTLLLGVILGMLLSFLALVVMAFKWGPQGESCLVELYSGKMTLHKYLLWRHWEEKRPIEPHVQWAIDHQNPVKTWSMHGSSMSRNEWFGDMMAISIVIYMPTDCVYEIYSSSISEPEKIELLTQYHRELDLLKQKEEELRQQRCPELEKDMIAFKEKWEQRLGQIESNGQVDESGG